MSLLSVTTYVHPSATWAYCSHITKTCLYKFDPLKPHFYVVKLEFTGVYTIFLISAEAVLTSTHNLCFEQNYEKYEDFLTEKFSFFGGKIFSVFE